MHATDPSPPPLPSHRPPPRSGRRVRALDGAAGIADAVTAGVDGIEHCTFITRSGVRPDPRTIDAMAEAGVFVGCTVVEPMDGMPAEVLAVLEPMWQNMAAMHARGVRVVCCTDAGVGPFKPHDVLPRDLVHFASRVTTNTAALASVTSPAADSCGLGHRKGRLAPGYDADLLAAPTRGTTSPRYGTSGRCTGPAVESTGRNRPPEPGGRTEPGPQDAP
ncbi:amidohydrolase family protein [Streptomyces sp. NPDC001663]|uniref:amidohydrolase family protein n=1 Tax=Streptomyces sp. NPDC001663 TaxID=3364597 RepID=UPI0036878FDA